jgi:LysR family hydrogen peroxide-inducible transcriptional activator
MIDCGIASTPLSEPLLAETPLFYENFVAYVSENSCLMKKVGLKPEDIDPSELWILNEGHCMRNQVLNICQNRRETNGNMHYEYNTGSIDTLKRMVDENNGATILPELALIDLTEDQRKKLRYFKNPAPAREISMITLKNFVKRGLIDALKNEIIDLIPVRLKEKLEKELVQFKL